MEKQCMKCGEVKPLDAFYRHPQMADGHLNKCKECAKRDVRENRAAKADYYRAYDAKRYKEDPSVRERHARYAATAAGKASLDRARAKWNENNPTKREAHGILARAIRAGRVAKPTRCFRCNATGRLEGHHHDYSCPLDVEWLCPACHRATHA